MELEKERKINVHIEGVQYIWRETVEKGKIEFLLESFWQKFKDDDYHMKFQYLTF